MPEVGVGEQLIKGWDGTRAHRLRVESSAYPNLRTRLYAGGYSIGSEVRSGDDYSRWTRGLTTIGCLYAFDGSYWDRVRTGTSTDGSIRTTIYGEGSPIEADYPNTDSKTGTRNALSVLTFNYTYGEDGYWHRVRGNYETTVLASAARTASGNQTLDVNYSNIGIYLLVDVTAVSGTFATGEGLSFKLQARVEATGAYYDLTPDVGPFTTTGLYKLGLHPTATDNQSIFNSFSQLALPTRPRFTWTITGTSPSFTFSVSASYLR